MPVQHMMREIGRFRSESWGMYRYALSRVDEQAESIASLKGAASTYKYTTRMRYTLHPPTDFAYTASRHHTHQVLHCPLLAAESGLHVLGLPYRSCVWKMHAATAALYLICLHGLTLPLLLLLLLLLPPPPPPPPPPPLLLLLPLLCCMEWA
eukprot:COSAG06_NODE_25153_length_643_cov_3.255515_2_plen_152_part_00